ncbi:hypothetical protein K458DRAFT_484820 [Lentithecium fluviatile CBS 122367]|uniref:Uncharacterized protein n=1 Tax=Lentithecium fluviatile CBS 122367 TaxID=1168545 RepID=A0A6G1JEM5_9PLEO|nr:hypothetical protein K458DRAFT_484820 [Lentithecium fluviatile CBS 122367]
MATSDPEAPDETNRTAMFWNEEKRDLFKLAMDDIGGWDKVLATSGDESQLLLVQTLPALARNLDGKAIDGLRKANPWLAIFEPGSSSDWAKAKSAFIENGPGFLDTLASFTELKRIDCLIGYLLAKDVGVSTRLLKGIRDELERIRGAYGDARTVDERVKRRVVEVPREMLDTGEAQGLSNVRIDALLRNVFKAEDMYWGRNTSLPERFIFECIFKSVWETHGVPYRDPAFDPVRDDFKIFVHYTYAIINRIRENRAWLEYTDIVQSFVRQVGCAKTHKEPEENIAELRLFHSTTIGYFAKLQDQYVNKVLEVKKLRHHITALEFRSLIENLTPPCQPGTRWSDPNSGPRWMTFWEEALKDEYNRNLNQTQSASNQTQDHALKEIVDARNPKRISKQNGVATIHKEGQNGQLYRTGKDLYGTLSDEIHRFQGKEFEVGDDDGWTKLVADTLRALKPLEQNINEHGMVDWDAERKRYL